MDEKLTAALRIQGITLLGLVASSTGVTAVASYFMGIEYPPSWLNAVAWIIVIFVALPLWFSEGKRYRRGKRTQPSSPSP